MGDKRTRLAREPAIITVDPRSEGVFTVRWPSDLSPCEIQTKPKGARGQQFYAQTAVESYVQLAQTILNDPYRILVVSDILLRAAAVAKRMPGSGLTAEVQAGISAIVAQLRTAGRFRDVAELVPASLQLPGVAPALLQVLHDALEEGAQRERKAGRALQEGMFLQPLADIAVHRKHAEAQHDLLRRRAEALVSAANMRKSTSRLAAAAFLEDAALLYQRAGSPEKRDALLREIHTLYEAAIPEFGRLEVRAELPAAMIDQLYDSLAPLPLNDALLLLGDRERFQPDFSQVQAFTGGLISEAPIASAVGRQVIRAATPKRRADDDQIPSHSLIERHFVLAINGTAVVIGILLDRLIAEKGLDANSLTAYMERWPLMDARHLPFTRRGFERYVAEDYISALHILTPQVEGVLRSALQAVGITTTILRQRGEGIDLQLLSALLHRKDVQQALGGELWRYLDVALTSQTGVNLHNSVAHGLIAPAQATKVTCALIIHLLLCVVAVPLALSNSLDPELKGVQHDTADAHASHSPA